MTKKYFDYENNEAVTSKSLHDDLNREREKNGEDPIPAVNPGGGGANTNAYSSRDKSYSNLIDFFVKFFRSFKKKSRKDNNWLVVKST